MTAIGRSLNVTRARVSYILTNSGQGGRHEYPELASKEFFDNKLDAEIAKELGVAESRVSAARRELGVRRVKPADLPTRREMLCHYLFGKEYQPGPKFVPYVRSSIEICLTNLQAEYIDTFYLSGMRDFYGKNRLYRHYSKRRLKERLIGDVELLTKMEVLRHAS